MSDRELVAFMRQGFAFQTGYAAAICCQKEPSPVDACRKVRNEMTKIEKAADDILQKEYITSLAAFQRSYGSEAAANAFKIHLDTYEEKLKRNTSRITPAACKSVLNAVEGFSYLDQHGMATVFTNLVSANEFAAERPHVPQCR